MSQQSGHHSRVGTHYFEARDRGAVAGSNEASRVDRGLITVGSVIVISALNSGGDGQRCFRNLSGKARRAWGVLKPPVCFGLTQMLSQGFFH